MKTDQTERDSNNIEAVLKAVSELSQRVARLEAERSREILSSLGFPGIDPNEPLVKALQREIGGGKKVRVVSLGELFEELEKELAQPQPETFEEGVARILREFGKGCSNGKPGECEDCLAGAVRAIAKLAAK